MSAWRAAREAFERRARALARDFPILWRTRLPVVLAVVLIVDVILIGVASIWPVDSRAPSIDSIQLVAVNALTLLMASFGLWLAHELRQGLGAWSWRRRFRVGLCYAVGIFTVLTMPLAFVLPWLDRLADTVSDEQLAEDQAFHSAFGYWMCDPRVTDEAVQRHDDAIISVVQRYQRSPVDDVGVFRPGRYTASWPCVERLPLVRVRFRDMPRKADDPVISIQDSIESLEAAKDLRRGDGPFAFFVVTYLAATLAFGFLLPCLLVWLDARRRRERPMRLGLPSVHLPSTTPFLNWRRLDRYLVTRWPLFWSSKVHAILPLTVAGSLLLVLVAWVPRWFEADLGLWNVWLSMWRSDNIFLASGGIPALTVGIFGLWWLGQRGVRLAARSTVSDLTQVVLPIVGLFAVLPIVAVVLLVFEPSSRSEATEAIDSWLLLSLIAIFWCIAVFVSKRYASWTAAWPGLISAGGSLVILVLEDGTSLDDTPVGALLAGWLVLSLSLLLGWPRSWLVGLRSTLVLTGAPIFGVLLGSRLYDELFWVTDWKEAVFVAMCLSFVLAVVIVSRPMRRHHAAPKP